MKLYEILIPIQDNAGALYPVGLCSAFLQSIAARTGGYTLAGTVKGMWRDDSGAEYYDACSAIRVACEPDDMAAIIADALATFADQKCILSYVIADAVTFTNREAPRLSPVDGQRFAAPNAHAAMLLRGTTD